MLTLSLLTSLSLLLLLLLSLLLLFYPCLYKDFLKNLNSFNFASISNEDRKRKKMYIDERIRRDTKKNTNNENDWLKKINTKIKCKILDETNFNRTLQLINKTNQLGNHQN